MKRRVFFIALLVLVLGGFAWLALRPREPVYQGKTLSEWLTLDKNGAAAEGTDDAIHHFGTNAIPTLLHMLRAHDFKLKLQLVALAAKQHFVNLHFVPAEEQNGVAAWVFRDLGPSASNAVPELIQILNEKVSESSQHCTIASLGSIGPAARAAVPDLARILDNTNAAIKIRRSAALALVAVRTDSVLVVPVLIKCLKDPDRDIRLYATQALWLLSLGSDAKAAVPGLVDLLRDPDVRITRVAKYALKKIDSQAAAKAGIQ